MNEVQEKELGVLVEVLKVLKKHNLRYFAIGGTCIGAIRHKGFIPWDDDIDIAMPRKDFELFRTEYYKELPEHLQKIDGEVSRSHNFLFMKIHDSRTTYVEYYAENSPDRYSGVFVDIMPVDGLPPSEKEISRLFRQLNHWKTMNNLCRPGDMSPTSRKEQLRIGMKRIVKSILQKIYPHDYFYHKITAEMQKYPYDTSEKVLFTWRRTSNKRSRIVYDASLFAKLTDVPFENTMIQVNQDYDKYLTLDFGNYMQLPPEEEQHTVHHVYKEDMNKPCSYYAELKKKELKLK